MRRLTFVCMSNSYPCSVNSSYRIELGEEGEQEEQLCVVGKIPRPRSDM